MKEKEPPPPKSILKESRSSNFKEKVIKSSRSKKVNFNESSSDQMAEFVIILEKKLISLAGRVEGLESQVLEKGGGVATGIFSTPVSNKFQIATYRRQYDDGPYLPPVSNATTCTNAVVEGNDATNVSDNKSAGNWIADWFQLANLDTTT